jgi:hypothetical protein
MTAAAQAMARPLELAAPRRQAARCRECPLGALAVKHFKFELRGKRRMHRTPSRLEILACARS